MTKEQLDIYVGYGLLVVFPIITIVLFNIVRKTWSNYQLRVRNYLFIFCMFAGLVCFIVVIFSLLYKQGILTG